VEEEFKPAREREREKETEEREFYQEKTNQRVKNKTGKDRFLV